MHKEERLSGRVKLLMGQVCASKQEWSNCPLPEPFTGFFTGRDVIEDARRCNKGCGFEAGYKGRCHLMVSTSFHERQACLLGMTIVGSMYGGLEV